MIAYLQSLLLDPATGALNRDVALQLLLLAVSAIGTGVVALLPKARAAVAASAKWVLRKLLPAPEPPLALPPPAPPPAAPPGRWREPTVSELHDNARILVIDDTKFAHYEQLVDRGFAVEQWKRVDSAQSPAIDRNFDLVVLDYKNVRDGFGAKDGLTDVPPAGVVSVSRKGRQVEHPVV